MGKHSTSSRNSHKKPLIGAALALVAAAALIGGPVTSASLNDAAANTISDTVAGSLAVEARTSSWETVALATPPSNMVLRGSGGVVPGVRAQKVTLTARNSNASATPALLSGTIKAPKNATLQALEAAGLQYTVVASPGCKADAISTVGTDVQAAISSTAALTQGAVCTFVLTLSIPCAGAACETAAWNLRGQRLVSLPAFTVNATLTQVARS
jgi:hypothetical protein